ncbi:hypothetical protein [Novosphingobium sp. UBA1939]|uniref:hypothetical protein n=1 Tax=Novosphingobium sp. UBA1939 TaxID=1946982 RepID=UPI0025FA8B41|nr:hypothetical protein [Novosphingobium sp. UBA1939]
MSRRNIGDIGLPAATYRVDRAANSEFETEKASQAEGEAYPPRRWHGMFSVPLSDHISRFLEQFYPHSSADNSAEVEGPMAHLMPTKLR